MNILLVAATSLEVNFLVNSGFFQKVSPTVYRSEKVTLLITGVGMTETTLQLSSWLCNHKPDHILNVGVAGTYKDLYMIGQLVEVIQDQYGDLGAEEADDSFLQLPDMNLTYPIDIIEGKINVPKSHHLLHSVKSITVNTVAGTSSTIEKRTRLFEADVETMEGFAVFRVAKHFSIPASQVRAISNTIEPRNKDSWNLPLAIKELNDFLIKHIVSIKK